MPLLIVRALSAAFLFFMAYLVYHIAHEPERSYSRIANARTARADGKVTAVVRDHPSRSGDTVSQTVTIRFAVPSGAELSFDGSLLGRDAKVGMSVQVDYDPDQPGNHAVVQGTHPSYVYLWAYLIVAVFAIGGLVNLWGLRRALRELRESS